MQARNNTQLITVKLKPTGDEARCLEVTRSGAKPKLMAKDRPTQSKRISNNADPADTSSGLQTTLARLAQAACTKTSMARE